MRHRESTWKFLIYTVLLFSKCLYFTYKNNKYLPVPTGEECAGSPFNHPWLLLSKYHISKEVAPLNLFTWGAAAAETVGYTISALH